jgi:hypothetical protein
MAQLLVIGDELETARQIQDSIETQTNTLEQLREFSRLAHINARTATEEILNQELEELRDKFESMLAANEEAIARVKKRHELSIKATKLRAERIINAAERYFSFTIVSQLK